MLFSQVISNAPNFFSLVPLVVAFPTAGLLINLIFGGRFSEKLIGTIASSASGLAFVVAVLQAISLLGNPQGTVLPLVEWIKVGSLDIHWGFQVDTLSVTMMLVVSGVGTLIHIYAIGYMHEDVRHNNDPGRFRRFFVFFNLFILAMLVLVSADSYLMMFIGWEGVGLCSYLLIGFWYEKGKDEIGNAIAAKKAFVFNRIGDFGFLIAAFLIFTYFGTFDFNAVSALAPQIAVTFPGVILAITLFLLLAVTGKSAQLPLFAWLPDAMAGPTPVSALIHAATMVTAGVYLIARSYALYALVPLAQNSVALVGGLTALFAATIAVAQFDIKRVLAYSTISQLGYMVAAVGMGAFAAGLFHLITHAFFKALLFLAAGSVIQGVERGEHLVAHDPKLKKNAKPMGHEFDPQDMRNMGGLRQRMKITYWTYLIAAIAISGVPPLAGFWSKDEILAAGGTLNPTVYWLLVAAAFLTAFYMGRQILMVFFGKPRSSAAEHANESPAVMTIPLMILGGLSLVGGLVNFPGIDSLTLWLEHTIETIKEIPFNPIVAALSTTIALLAIAISYYFYEVRYKAIQSLPKAKRIDDPLRGVLGPVFYWMERKWFVDELYETIIVRPYKWVAHMVSRGEAVGGEPSQMQIFMHDVVYAGGLRVLSDLLALIIDLGFVTAFGSGMAVLLQRGAGGLRKIQTGFVRNYALVVFLGVVLIIGYLILR
jgi:NADH-quinone oxidoreductase subunit L